METNEIVFMTQENADRVNNVNQGIKEGEQDLTNWWANKARQDLSTARLTEKTAKDMAKHWGRSPERGGVLFINKETQELEVFRCIPCEENSNTFDLSKLYAKAGNIKFGVFTDEINGDPFVLWHTHPETSFFGSFPSLPDGAFPTNDIFGAWGLQDVDIYQKYFKKEGTKSSLLEGVGLVLTNETLTIFPLGSIDNIYNSDRPFKSKFENDFEPSGIDRGTTGTDPIRQFGSFKTGNLELKTTWKE